MTGLLSQMSLTPTVTEGRMSGGGRIRSPRRVASVAGRTAVWSCKVGAQNALGGVWAPSRFPAWGCAPVHSGVQPSEDQSEAAEPTSGSSRAGTSGPGDHTYRLPRGGDGTPPRRCNSDHGLPVKPRAPVRWHYGMVQTQQCPNPRRHLVASVSGQKVPVAAGTARLPVGAGAAGRDTRFSHHDGDPR